MVGASRRLNLANQHYPDGKSKLTAEELGKDHVKLTYSGLTDGARRFDDETFALELKVEEKSLDLAAWSAARVSTRMGGRAGIPSLDDLRKRCRKTEQ